MITLDAMRHAAPRQAAFPPGPPRRKANLIGQLRYFWNFATDPIGFVARRFDRYGDMYYAPASDGHLYVLRHPDHMREVFLNQAAKFKKKHTAFEQLAQVLGNGLVNSDGDVWRRHRRMIQPAFHPKRLAEYAEAMIGETEKVASRWRHGQVYDMADEMTELTLRVVCKTLFSHDVTGEANDVGRAMVTLQDSMARPDLLPAWMPSPQRKRIANAIGLFDSIIYELIDQRTPNDGAAPSDLLQRLVDAVDEEGDGKGLSRTEVRDELVTMFIAGHETTSQALTWTWYLLSRNAQAERKLRAELRDVLAGRTPRYEDLPKLDYTEQVLKEAMRLYPPVFMLARRAEQDATIGRYTVPAGSEVVTWIYMTHHDPRWYPQPDEFRPERFAPENEKRLPKLAYMPFGAGARSCIGKVFAMNEAKLAVATIAQKFRFTLEPSQRIGLKPRITLSPKYGMRMRATRPSRY